MRQHDYATQLMLRHQQARLERVNRTHWMYRDLTRSGSFARRWVARLRKRPFIRNGIVHPVGADSE